MMVRLVSWRDIDSGPLQVIVENHTRTGAVSDTVTNVSPRTDGFAHSETVVTRQDHHQGLLDEKPARQVSVVAVGAS